MTRNKMFLASIALVFMATACGKAESQAESASEEQTQAETEAEARKKDEQESTSEESEAADGESPPGGLTKQQYEQTLAIMVASGMTKEQAEAMLDMADGGAPVIGDSGMPVAMEEIAAMDPRVKAEEERDKARAESLKNSGVSVRYDGINYPMQYTQTPQCIDFFGFSSVSFIARTSPDAERGPTLNYSSGYTVQGAPGSDFSFWLDFNPEHMFDRKYATVGLSFLDRDGVISAFDRDGAELNLENSEGLVIEKSRLFYEGPVAKDSDKTITIEIIYCPE